MMEKSRDKFNPLAELLSYRYPWSEVLQAIQATLIYFLCKTLIFPLAPSTTLLASLNNFFLFLISLHMFSGTLYVVCSPSAVHRLSPPEFLIGVLKLIFNYGDKPYRRRLLYTWELINFVVYSGICATISVTSITASSMVSSLNIFGALLGIRGFVAGLIYASHCRRWLLEFPIIQRAPFFSYKKGVRKAVIGAIKLSTSAYFLTLVPSLLTNYYKCQLARGDLIKEEIVFYLACVVVFLCRELNRNILQVIFTERLVFAPQKVSAAEESNPSNCLLAGLEHARLLERCLAYYDLCMVSESNVEVDTWRRAAFFEKTGETYKKVIVACLKPLEQLTLDLSSSQLCVSNDFNEPFYEFQIFAWCARIASSLTVCSHKEDRFGVAQLSGSITATISTLLASLLAVETLMRNDKGSPHYSKAYSMADILRTSIYQIVSVFHQEMVASSKVGRLQKDWITSDKPLYGSHKLLVQKLQMFIESNAN